jgi:hypothetical protein
VPSTLVGCAFKKFKVSVSRLLILFVVVEAVKLHEAVPAWATTNVWTRWWTTWRNSETTLAAMGTEYNCDESVGCLEKRLGRRLTPADFPPGWDDVPTYMSKRLRNRAYGT